MQKTRSNSRGKPVSVKLDQGFYSILRLWAERTGLSVKRLAETAVSESNARWSARGFAVGTKGGA